MTSLEVINVIKVKIGKLSTPSPATHKNIVTQSRKRKAFEELEEDAEDEAGAGGGIAVALGGGPHSTTETIQPLAVATHRACGGHTGRVAEEPKSASSMSSGRPGTWETSRSVGEENQKPR